jgi:hypothetical protein
MTRLLDLKMTALALGIAASPLLAQEPEPAAIMEGIASRAGADLAALGAPDAEGPTLVSIDFAHDMPPEAFAAEMESSAAVVAEAPGLLWKVWSVDSEAGLANGTYLFSGRDAARFYLDHVFPMGPPSKEGVSDVEIRVMGVMDGPSRTTRAPLG